MMRTITKRMDKLEDLLGIAAAKHPCRVWGVRTFGRELAVDEDRCIDILRECGFLPNGTRFAVVQLCRVPDGLNVQELEKFLRENGAEICGCGR